MKTLKYALVSWEVAGHTIDENLARAEDYVRQAAERGAGAIGFVEYFAILGTDVKPGAAAETPGAGPVTRWAVDAARKYGIEIWCPFIELGPDGRKYNAVAIVDPVQGIVGTHYEFHFFALDKTGLSIGPELRVTQRPWGKLGCFVCFDIHYAEAARILALQGADVVFWPTMTAGPWSVEAVRQKAAVRCMDNGFWLIESNLGAVPPYAPYAGKHEPGSCVFDPEGNKVASTGYRPGLVLAELDLERGSYGKFIFGMDAPVDDLRVGFKQWLRPEYYAAKYVDAAKNQLQ